MYVRLWSECWSCAVGLQEENEVLVKENQVLRCQLHAQVEQIKYFRLIDVLLTAEDDELTATMKLKRSFVEKKHKALIDSMY